MQLTGKQAKALCEAMLEAFPSYAALKGMVRFELDAKLAVIAGEGKLDDVVLNLVEWAEAQDRVDDLLAGAITGNAANKRLKQVAFEVIHTSPTPAKPEGRFEAKVLKQVLTLPFEESRALQDACARAVGRFEIPLGNPRVGGTAFLIGKDLVLTNRHVVDFMAELGNQPTDCGVRFDYRSEDAEGQPFRLAADWEHASSPKENLDYAVVRLQGSPAVAPISFHDDAFTPGDIEYILHHPNAEPLAITPGEILRTEAGRVVYSVNTECGSSGSPVFTTGWKAVALHHFGDDSGNVGIPLITIRHDLEAKGKWIDAPAAALPIVPPVISAAAPARPGNAVRVQNLKRIHAWLHTRQLELLNQLRPLYLRFPKGSSVTELTVHANTLGRELFTFAELCKLPQAKVLYLNMEADLKEVHLSLETAIQEKRRPDLLKAIKQLERVLGQTMPAVDGAIMSALDDLNPNEDDPIRHYSKVHHRYQSIDADLRLSSQFLDSAPFEDVTIQLGHLIRQLEDARDETPSGDGRLDMWKDHLTKAIDRLKQEMTREDRRRMTEQFVAVVHLANERFNGADQNLLTTIGGAIPGGIQ
ncbi:MAG: trypsin-like peptidase domain-containing protein [Acidobacteria bacterium]|nr:trypsin-like peptidase domain-containing protein [Acidobacteriota bacterium]